MFQDLKSAFAWLEGLTNFEKSLTPDQREYRLDRMQALLAHFGNPQDSFQSLHLAGSKGKGSTALFLARMLKAAGLRLGLYLSPHIQDYRERITLGGDFFPAAVYLEEINHIYRDYVVALAPQGLEPTTFELLTVLAFLVFRREGCTWAVVETGLGGRLDATNLIRPRLSILTLIELEHQDILGDTIDLIAREKAGIMKAGIPALVLPQRFDEAREVFRERARELGIPLWELENLVEWEVLTPGSQHPRDTGSAADSGGGLVIRGRWLVNSVWPGEPRDFVLEPLFEGRHLASNLVLALAALGILEESRPLASAILASAASMPGLPGRLEYLPAPAGSEPGEPGIWLDAAHTRESVAELCHWVRQRQQAPAVLVFGSVEGKATAAMVEQLAGLFPDVVVSRPGTFKRSQPENIAQLFRERGCRVQLLPEAPEALAAARNLARAKGGDILVCGSFYLLGDFRQALEDSGLVNPAMQGLAQELPGPGGQSRV